MQKDDKITIKISKPRRRETFSGSLKTLRRLILDDYVYLVNNVGSLLFLTVFSAQRLPENIPKPILNKGDNMKMRLSLSVFVATALLAVSSVQAASLAAGEAAYERGDYATALREWQPLAQRGNAEAQNALGVMYENGEGVAPSNARALAWYRKAAAQGHAEAQNNLGAMYYEGLGVKQNYAQAFSLFQKSAAKGSGRGLFNMGWMYANGYGTAQDLEKARMIWELLARGNYGDQSQKAAEHLRQLNQLGK